MERVLYFLFRWLASLTLITGKYSGSPSEEIKKSKKQTFLVHFLHIYDVM